jgi:hypothetical protein
VVEQAIVKIPYEVAFSTVDGGVQLGRLFAEAIEILLESRPGARVADSGVIHLSYDAEIPDGN